MKLLCFALIFLPISISIARDLPQFSQEQLDFETGVDPCRVAYTNSLFIDPYEPGYLGPPDRIFRCGERVIVRSSGARAIVMDYNYDGASWIYALLPR